MRRRAPTPKAAKPAAGEGEREPANAQPKSGGETGESTSKASSAEGRATGQESQSKAMHRQRVAANAARARATKQRAKPERSELAAPGEQKQPGPDSAKAALAEAKTNQKAIADELQKMLDGLSEFETYRGVVKDAQELLKQQEQTMKQTAEAADKPEMIGKPLDALDARAEGRARQPGLAAIAGRQGPAEPAGADGRDGAPAG